MKITLSPKHDKYFLLPASEMSGFAAHIILKQTSDFQTVSLVKKSSQRINVTDDDTKRKQET